MPDKFIRKLAFALITIWAVYTGSSLAATTNVEQAYCQGAQAASTGKLTEHLCTEDGALLTLRYNNKSGKIILESPRGRSILERIPRDYDPALTGADRYIGFLPVELQPYRRNRKLLYLSAIRSTGGNGGGECGAGSEIFLNVLDLANAHPQVMSRTLIGSCSKNIELSELSDPPGNLAGFSVADGRLHLDFLFYKEIEESLSALLSNDLKALEFLPVPAH